MGKERKWGRRKAGRKRAGKKTLRRKVNEGRQKGREESHWGERQGDVDDKNLTLD